MQIETGLYHRQGEAATNFERTLPAPQSDLARETLKDPYNFEFLTIAEDAHERVIELKAGSFKPEYAGKLNMFLHAVDDILNHPDDKPSIGLLLVKQKDQLVVEYSLAGTRKPT